LEKAGQPKNPQCRRSIVCHRPFVALVDFVSANYIRGLNCVSRAHAYGDRKHENAIPSHYCCPYLGFWRLPNLAMKGVTKVANRTSPQKCRPGDSNFYWRHPDHPAGGKETAHQIINTSEEELRFLAVSTKLSPEIAEYPDTNRFDVLASLAPDETGRPRTMMYVDKEGGSLYYWEGE
jgi:hypothetical protein